MLDLLNIISHAQSFANINDIIRTEAGAALDSIEKHLNDGWTEEEVVDEWNKIFETEANKFKTFDELDEWLRTIGI